MAVQTQIQTRRGTAASWTSTNPTLAAGEIGFETDTGKFKIGNGSTAWASLAYSAGATAVTYLFNATGGQTTFSGADANGLTLAYTVGAEQVYLNGVLQVRGSDYTATNGTSIVLTSGALVSDVLNVIAYSAMTITDTYTQAQADAKFFQTANAFVAGKNKIINGDFGVWQRGTSFTFSGSSGYSSDRWVVDGDRTSMGATQQTFTPGAAPVAGYEGQFFLRWSPGTSGTFSNLQTRLEDVRTFAGQTVTLSYWAKCSTGTLTNEPYYLQRFGSGGSPDNAAALATSTITTTWTRFSQTFTVPSISGKTIGTSSSLIILPVRLGSGTTTTVDVWGVQLEAGSIATPFQTATGTIQGELAACQRYFNRFTSGPIALSNYFTTTRVLTPVALPVQMRIAPTGITSNSAAFTNYVAGSGRASSAVVFNSATPKVLELDITTAADTAGRVGSMTLDSGSFDVSAEL
jgi:hypothetical protein